MVFRNEQTRRFGLSYEEMIPAKSKNAARHVHDKIFYYAPNTYGRGKVRTSFLKILMSQPGKVFSRFSHEDRGEEEGEPKMREDLEQVRARRRELFAQWPRSLRALLKM